MKKFKNLTKAVTVIIAALMLLSSCAAADGMGGMNGGGYVDNLNPSFGEDAIPPSSSPDYSFDVEADDEVIGGIPDGGVDNSGNTTESPGTEMGTDIGSAEGSEEASNEASEESSAISGDPVPEEWRDLITNPFTSTAKNNISTFSADVDTASYTYFRNLVNRGYKFNELVNSGSSFRTEEFINYFRYQVDQPADGELFGVKTEVIPCPWNSENLLFRATLQTEIPENDVPNNLVFLIDVSGSMSSSNKLPLLKTSFNYLISNLDANDTISIVTYSGQEAVVLDGCSGKNGDEIMSAINSLVASGSTNGQAGLEMAYQIAEKHFSEGANNRIIMASDGDLNVGISSASELTSYIEQKRDQGIYLSVLGFGTGNYKDENMEALADNGNGVYYYIDGESEAEKVFGTDLVGTLYTVAEDVKLQIEFDPELIEAYRLIGYDNRVLDNEDFENDAKDAGEVGAGHQVTVCYEIKVSENLKSYSSLPTLMTLRVRYKNPGESISLLNEYEIKEDSFKTEQSEDMKFISAVIKIASLLRHKDYCGEITVDSIYAELVELELEDSYKIEFRELVKALTELTE